MRLFRTSWDPGKQRYRCAADPSITFRHVWGGWRFCSAKHKPRHIFRTLTEAKEYARRHWRPVILEAFQPRLFPRPERARALWDAVTIQGDEVALRALFDLAEEEGINPFFVIDTDKIVRRLRKDKVLRPQRGKAHPAG
jgi:hypothetical protein